MKRVLITCFLCWWAGVMCGVLAAPSELAQALLTLGGLLALLVVLRWESER